MFSAKKPFWRRTVTRNGTASEGDQPPAVASVTYTKVTLPKGPPVARVRFLVDTVHPDYGQVKKGEVLIVDRQYVAHYEQAKIAIEADDAEVSRPKPKAS